MSTNFNNLPSLLNKPAQQSSGSTHGVGGAGTLADMLGKGSGADSQAFAKLMTQYQNPKATAQVNLPSAGASQVSNAAQAMRAKAAAAQSTAQMQRQQQPTPAKSEAQAQPPQQAKPAQKTNTQTKPNNEAKAKPKQTEATDKQSANAAKADKSGKADAKGDVDQRGDEVKFTTAQGEGAAQVRELQPPPDVAASDPASMMAWLASLSHGGEAAQASQADGALTEGGAVTGKPGDGSGAAGAGKGGPGALPTGTAALTTHLLGQQQALKGDPKMMAAEGQGAGAAIAAQDASSPLEFNALMARELSRPAGAGGPATESATHASATLPTPVDSPDFKNALAERVGMWVSGTPANGQMTAELRLNPEDMGPVHIRIVMDGQNAQVDFAAAHAETRQALEASLPALSSALEDAGLSLSGGGVSDQGASQAWAQQQQQGQGEGQARSMAWSGRGLGDEQPDVQAQAGLLPTPRPSARPGGLDLYA